MRKVRIAVLLALPVLFTIGCFNAADTTCLDLELIGGPGVYDGSTEGAASVHGAECASASGSEVAYQLDLASDSRVVLTTDGSEFDTVLHVRSGDCADGPEIACNDDGGAGTQSMIVLEHLTAGTYFIFVDGFGSTSNGTYYLDVQITPL